VPIALVARAAAAVPPGSVILLLADDPLVEVDLPAWCHDRGYELISIEAVEGEYRARVRAR
jgi:tRNA 2-thiouridine synthesizing protein A